MADPTPEDEAEGAAKVDRLGPRASEEARRPLAHRNPTPKERAFRIGEEISFLKTNGEVFDLILREIREAEAAARAKAFEEAATVMDRLAATARTNANSARNIQRYEAAFNHDKQERTYMDGAAEIRARAKEAPK